MDPDADGKRVMTGSHPGDRVIGADRLCLPCFSTQNDSNQSDFNQNNFSEKFQDKYVKKQDKYIKKQRYFDTNKTQPGGYAA